MVAVVVVVVVFVVIVVVVVDVIVVVVVVDVFVEKPPKDSQERLRRENTSMVDGRRQRPRRTGPYKAHNTTSRQP